MESKVQWERNKSKFRVPGKMCKCVCVGGGGDGKRGNCATGLSVRVSADTGPTTPQSAVEPVQ